MPKTRKQSKKRSGGTRKNIFGFKRKQTPLYSDKAYNKQGDIYEDLGYKQINHLVKQADKEGKLAQGWTVSSVDRELSKYADEPRNIDGVNRLTRWTKHILKTKSYSKSRKEFMEELLNLKDRTL